MTEVQTDETAARELFYELQRAINATMNKHMSRKEINTADLVHAILPQTFASVLVVLLSSQLKSDAADDEELVNDAIIKIGGNFVVSATHLYRNRDEALIDEKDISDMPGTGNPSS